MRNKLKFDIETCKLMKDFHGINLVTELKEVAKDLINLGTLDKNYVIEQGKYIKNVWIPEKEISQDNFDSLEQEWECKPRNIEKVERKLKRWTHNLLKKHSQKKNSSKQ